MCHNHASIVEINSKEKAGKFEEIMNTACLFFLKGKLAATGHHESQTATLEHFRCDSRVRRGASLAIFCFSPTREGMPEFNVTHFSTSYLRHPALSSRLTLPCSVTLSKQWKKRNGNLHFLNVYDLLRCPWATDTLSSTVQ